MPSSKKLVRVGDLLRKGYVTKAGVEIVEVFVCDRLV